MFWKWLLGKGITRKMRNQASSCLGTLLGHIPGAVTLLKYLKCWYQEWTMPQILLVPYQLSLMENRFSCPRPRDFNVRLQMCFSPGYFSSLTCLLPREACSADPPPPRSPLSSPCPALFSPQCLPPAGAMIHFRCILFTVSRKRTDLLCAVQLLEDLLAQSRCAMKVC